MIKPVQVLYFFGVYRKTPFPEGAANPDLEDPLLDRLDEATGFDRSGGGVLGKLRGAPQSGPQHASEGPGDSRHGGRPRGLHEYSIHGERVPLEHRTALCLPQQPLKCQALSR